MVAQATASPRFPALLRYGRPLSGSALCLGTAARSSSDWLIRRLLPAVTWSASQRRSTFKPRHSTPSRFLLWPGDWQTSPKNQAFLALEEAWSGLRGSHAHGPGLGYLVAHSNRPSSPPRLHPHPLSPVPLKASTRPFSASTSSFEAHWTPELAAIQSPADRRPARMVPSHRCNSPL